MLQGGGIGLKISEAINSVSDREKLLGKAYEVGIDLSENGDAEYGDFTALRENCRNIRVYVQPRVAVRKYVDGDKTIPLSDFVRVVFRYYPSSDNVLQKRLLEAAYSCSRVRCICAELVTGAFTEAFLLPCITAVCEDDIFGEIIEFELT